MRNLNEEELLGVNGGYCRFLNNWVYGPEDNMDDCLDGGSDDISPGIPVDPPSQTGDQQKVNDFLQAWTDRYGGSNPITCYREGNITVVNNRGRGGSCRLEP